MNMGDKRHDVISLYVQGRYDLHIFGLQQHCYHIFHFVHFNRHTLSWFIDKWDMWGAGWE